MFTHTPLFFLLYKIHLDETIGSYLGIAPQKKLKKKSLEINL